MSEQRNVTDPEAAAEAEVPVVVRPEQEQPATAGAVRKGNRKVAVLVAAAVGVVALAGSGLWAAKALDDADRTSPTRYWLSEDHTTGGTQPPVPSVPSVPPNELTGKLLPLPKHYWPGPDIDAEGNDYYVPAEKALQSFKDARTGLSGGERAERDKMLADLRLKGLAGRSYARGEGYGSAIAEIQLVQADPQQIAKFGEFAKKLIELTAAGGEAPQIDGHAQAKCGLDQLSGGEGDKKKIDALDCVAVEGDVLVTFRMYGSKGFAVKDAAGLFKQQLDHLKSPGESA
ncbi:hypothetical protein OG594_03395 [Streptomyces sp. NBC_01214]|uniref:hypothetical protein n=1 Tax=Streptomyces sp. NBC_01214 TaxID=2903777 RepID=UPI0022521A97|nr:hypothetical protein [Streptomyces sp. NBC_01214]MCX4800711.1 hypothetical protein [Streptomyces sp. NBC_01214]